MMLFIQGDRDPRAESEKIQNLVKELNPLAYLLMVPQADHGLKLINEEKRSQTDVDKEITEIIPWFMDEVLTKQIKD